MATVKGTGKGGRILKEDVQNALAVPRVPDTPPAVTETSAPAITGERVEKRVPMTRLRVTLAKRLLDAQHNAAMLTTFNEVNMGPLMDLRKQYKEIFEKKLILHMFECGLVVGLRSMMY